MEKRLLLLFALASLSGMVSAQTFTSDAKRYKGKFQYEAEAGETAMRSWFHYVVSTTSDGLWVIRTFYPETGRMTSKVTYADALLSVKAGPATYWYDDGTVSAKGGHSNNERYGPWTEIRGSGSYDKGVEHGPWMLRMYTNGQDSGAFETGERNGLWVHTDSLGRTLLSRHYKADKLDGEWIKHDHTSGETDRRVYRADTLVEGIANDPPVIETMPSMRGCEHLSTEKERGSCTESMIFGHLRKHLSYPQNPMDLGVSGKALFSYTVEKDGTISDLKALNGLCLDIENVCREIISTMPLWNPGAQFGKPVRVQYNQPIKFSLR